MIQLGGAFGLAFTTVINTSYHNRSLDAGVPAIDAQLNGLHAAFWLGAGFAGLALGLALVMLRGMGTIGKGKKVKQVESAGTIDGDGERNDVELRDRGQADHGRDEEETEGIGFDRGEKAV